MATPVDDLLSLEIHRRSTLRECHLVDVTRAEYDVEIELLSASGHALADRAGGLADWDRRHFFTIYWKHEVVAVGRAGDEGLVALLLP